MDRGLTLEGRYVESFRGYLEVRRNAEIYAWDRDEDDDGVSWTKRWMSSVESNDRNRGLRQELESDTLAPPRYEVGGLPVAAGRIQFVDRRRTIPPAELTLSEEGIRHRLVPRGDAFHLDKGGPDQLGDERLTYSGLPIPETATYFGRWDGQTAVAHQAEVKEGMLDGMIQDKGILHHLVGGSRETALAALKRHLARVKKIVRIVGLVACTIGGGVLFSGLTRILVFIPIIGPSVNRISGWMGMLAGGLLGLLTLTIAYLTSQPILLVGVAVVLVAALLLLAKNAARGRSRLRDVVAGSLGHAPTDQELGELGFVPLWQLANTGGEIPPDRRRHLDRWARRNGLGADAVEALTRRAEAESPATGDREKLEALVRYALADGRIDRAELKTLQAAAGWIGIGAKGLSAMMSGVQSGG